MTIVMVTPSGEEHGLLKELPNSVRFNDFKNVDPKQKEKLKKQKQEELKLVKVKYLNKYGASGMLESVYCDWAGEPLRFYKCLHNYEYEVPYGFVKKINASGMAERSKEDGPNEKGHGQTGLEQEHRFVPVGF